MFISVDGNWTDWSSWNECSVTCGRGLKDRERTCSNPLPQYGGTPCAGNATTSEKCNDDPCPSKNKSKTIFLFCSLLFKTYLMIIHISSPQLYENKTNRLIILNFFTR